MVIYSRPGEIAVESPKFPPAESRPTPRRVCWNYAVARSIRRPRRSAKARGSSGCSPSTIRASSNRRGAASTRKVAFDRRYCAGSQVRRHGAGKSSDPSSHVGRTCRRRLNPPGPAPLPPQGQVLPKCTPSIERRAPHRARYALSTGLTLFGSAAMSTISMSARPSRSSGSTVKFRPILTRSRQQSLWAEHGRRAILSISRPALGG